MGKLLIMSSNPQATPTGSEAPLAISDMNNIFTLLNIYQTLGGLVARTGNLEAITNSHTEKIERLDQWVLGIPHIEKDVEKNARDLNELGRRHDRDITELKKVAHTASMLGKIALGFATPVAAAIIIPILVFIYHAGERLFFLLFPK